MEHLSKKEIRAWFKENEPVIDIASNVLSKAKGVTKDNYSMYIIKIQE